MIDSQLDVTPEGKEIADNIIWNAGYFKVAAPLILVLASGMLPPRIREGFELPWNWAMNVGLEQFTKAYRQSRVIAPPQALYRSAYLRALKRTNAPLPPRDGGRVHKLVDQGFALVLR
jgi:uncharacterized protein (DUF2236 family)